MTPMFSFIIMAIVALPLIAAAANAVNLVAGDRLWTWRTVQRLTCSALFASFAGAVWVFVQILGDPSPREIIVYQWFTTGALSVDIGFLIDSLSAIMMLVVTGFSFLIAVFSINYMHNDASFTRYFSAMALFVFAMLVLVMGNNFVMLFLGWEAVGLCSYLLIGHYYQRQSAARAGTKAFVMNRVGDAGFLVGIFLIATSFGSVAYTDVFANLSKIDAGTATAICLCLLTGAIGKSAQLPLGTWLAKAMEGPTPSSALIHAATMVTAGVYMITRSHSLYDMAPIALAVVTIVGAVTAAYGATVGKTIADIKGILAASTTTQLGLMFVACGLGAYPVAIFHLVAHAFLKTFLFLTAPSILHHFHTFPDANEVDRRSGPVPVVYWLVLVGCIGLIAYPFGLGLFEGAAGGGLAPSFYVLTAVGAMAVFTTLFYAVSATKRIFGDHGHDHGDDHGHDHGHAHHARVPIAVPVLSVAAIIAIGVLLGLLPGGLGDTWFSALLAPVVSIEQTGASQSGLGFAVVAAMGLLMLSGWTAAIFMDRWQPELPGVRMLPARRLYVAAARRFWLDDIYHLVIVAGAVRLGAVLDRFDTRIIDRVVGAPAAASRVKTDSSIWEARFLAARSGGLAGIFGAPADPATAGAGGATDGLLPWLATTSARSTGQADAKIAATGTGMVGAITAYASGTSALFERDIISQGQGLIGWATGGAAMISGWVEHNIFDVGITSGVSRTGGAMGTGLYEFEEFLGRPLVIGTLVLFATLGLLWGIVS